MSETMGTIIVGGILLLVVAAILANMISKKKKGESSCGCGCSGCAGESTCHPQIEKTEKDSKKEE